MTLIFQLIAAAGLLVIVPVSFGFGSAFVSTLINSAVIIAAVYLSLRVSLVFPAIAVETPGRSLRSAFRSSRGLVLRLFLAAVLSALAFSAAAVAVGMLFARLPSIAIVAGVAFDMAIIAVGVAIVSQVYAWREQHPAE